MDRRFIYACEDENNESNGDFSRMYDGNLISELGAKRYLQGLKNQSFSNVNLFQSVQSGNFQWKGKVCHGCHGTSYRALKKEASWNDTLQVLSSIDPLVAGLADGVHHQTVGKLEVLGAGVERTAEGLHVLGDEKFSTVGAEN